MRSDWLKLKSGSDIRGEAIEQDGKAVQMTDELAETVSYVFAQFLAEKLGKTPADLTVAVGRDPRLSGPRLAAAAMRGLTNADCDVLDCGLCTTPAMFMTTVSESLHCDGAIMVTASHLPWTRNGLKFVTREGGLTGAEIEQILRRAQDTYVMPRLVKRVNFLEQYSEQLKDMVRRGLDTDVALPLLGLHVVVDAGNGSGGFYEKLLRELGADTEGSQFLEPDGRFPNHIPNPEVREAMDSLSQAVISSGADMGVIFDADCDRAAIVDATGKEINRNRLIALIAAILLEEHPGATFVTDSVTSSGLKTFINEWGGVHYRYKRGYRNVIDEAIRLNEEGIDCPLAIETSGHAALRENYFLDDGMYLVTRLVVEAMKRKREGQTLGSLIAELKEPVESTELRLRINCEDFRAAGQAVIDTVLAHTLDDHSWHLAPDNREGVRISFDLGEGVDNAWFLLRLSLHDPVLPLNVESDVAGGVKDMLSQLYEVIKDCPDVDMEPLRKAVEG
ncbi:MAG: phosphomannomutase/phosphoglucomutase [Candidatus Fimadaptatus sp.]|jgi:phosphomannomutase